MEQLKLTCECGDENHVMTLEPHGCVDECFYIEVRAYSERASLRERLHWAWLTLKGQDKSLSEFLIHPDDFEKVMGLIAAQKPLSATTGN